ncbi:MAG: hypothetical protein J0G98_19550, partial [Terrimonas ferruginea]|uniref:hypothetical protein n=1 Tax=Terrimonas ferruginea TaxID=249 RepID=UPI001ACEC71A
TIRLADAGPLLAVSSYVAAGTHRPQPSPSTEPHSDSDPMSRMANFRLTSVEVSMHASTNGSVMHWRLSQVQLTESLGSLAHRNQARPAPLLKPFVDMKMLVALACYSCSPRPLSEVQTGLHLSLMRF